jgi:hypothetical protein
MQEHAVFVAAVNGACNELVVLNGASVVSMALFGFCVRAL